MRYNLENIQFNKPQIIFIDSKSKFGAYNKRAIGFKWMSGDSNLFYVQREDRLYTDNELLIIALEKVIDIINEIVDNTEEKLTFEIFSSYLKDMSKINSFVDAYLSKLNSMNLINLSLLERKGIEVKFSEGLHAIDLCIKIDEAIDGYITCNDFQNETLFLSSVVSKQFDRGLFNIVKDRLIEYISIYENGIPGIRKRLITPDDESSVNQLLFTIPGYTKQTDNFKLDSYRRTLMVSRDSDLIIAAVNVIDGDNLIFPDSLVYLAATSFNIPIFILDSKEQSWYTKSVSERREIVKAKRLPELKYFKNVSFYFNSYNFETTWDTIKKLIKE